MGKSEAERALMMNKSQRTDLENQATCPWFVIIEVLLLPNSSLQNHPLSFLVHCLHHQTKTQHEI